MIDRSGFTPFDIVREIWTHLELPPAALSSLSLPGDGAQVSGQMRPVVPSSFKIGHLAQSTIALSALSAALAHSVRSPSPKPIPRTTVPLRHAVLEFHCERIYTLAGRPPPETWGPIGGLHPTADGHVRIHDNFPHHRRGALALLGLPETCTDRRAVSTATRAWDSVELETAALERGLAVYALRSPAQWDALPQAIAVSDFPIRIRRLEARGPASSSPPRPAPRCANPRRCLDGVRVLELSRVIAAPVAGKTLAAHGADVLWVTSPRLPDLPALDREFARGKRSVRLDLDRPADKARLLALARDADVVVQGYRPGSLAARGLGASDLAAENPGVVVANLSAFGPGGPWAGRRGFDSLVQTCGGANVAEAGRFGAGAAARAFPCQALDHGAGFLLAAGVCAALVLRERDRGAGRGVAAYVVDASLAGVLKYLRSLGQFEGRSGFEGLDFGGVGGLSLEEVRGYFETRPTAFGEMRFLRHSACVEGFETGWDRMPSPLGSDEAVWAGL
ncbi:CoA-transferase family III [Xylaria intraflava]|nr:CoA-transferase family III [Xylaria intraflava]